MELAAALALLVAIGVTAGLLASGSVARRCAALAGGLAGVGVPLLVPPANPAGRFALALLALLVVLRVIDLLRDGRDMPPLRRIWHLFAVFDTRLAEPRARGFDARLLVEALVWGAISALAIYLALFVANRVEGAAHYTLRWGCFVAFPVAVFEVVMRLMVLAYGLFGVRPPPLHDAPYLSRSVREFWGKRWNKSVGTWLRLNCHDPLARAGHPRAAVAAAFAVSALIHCYLVLVALGVGWSLVMASFFLLQVAFILIEDAVGVRRWRPAAGHAWAVAVLLASSPLFSEPILQMADALADGR